MERKKASEFPQDLLDLFDAYVHGGISRRAFIKSAERFAVGGLSAAALFEMPRPNYAWAIQVPPDDPRIHAAIETVPSPQGNGAMHAAAPERPLGEINRIAKPAKRRISPPQTCRGGGAEPEAGFSQARASSAPDFEAARLERGRCDQQPRPQVYRASSRSESRFRRKSLTAQANAFKIFLPPPWNCFRSVWLCFRGNPSSRRPRAAALRRHARSQILLAEHSVNG
jgi:hypothetical protein